MNQYRIGILLCGCLLQAAVLTAQDRCVEGDCKNGFGIMECECGYRYEGEFENGEKTGGKMIKEELVYTGDFQDDMPHGKGEIKFVDGSSYTGDFEYSRMHGEGEYRLSNGALYRGEMRADEFRGAGVRYPDSNDLNVFYAGYFKNDELNGFSIYVNLNTFTLKAGEYQNGMLHGKGFEINLQDKKGISGRFKKGDPQKTIAFTEAQKRKALFDSGFLAVISADDLLVKELATNRSIYLRFTRFTEIEYNGSLKRIEL